MVHYSFTEKLIQQYLQYWLGVIVYVCARLVSLTLARLNNNKGYTT